MVRTHRSLAVVAAVPGLLMAVLVIVALAGTGLPSASARTAAVLLQRHHRSWWALTLSWTVPMVVLVVVSAMTGIWLIRGDWRYLTAVLATGNVAPFSLLFVWYFWTSLRPFGVLVLAAGFSVTGVTVGRLVRRTRTVSDPVVPRDLVFRRSGQAAR